MESGSCWTRRTKLEKQLVVVVTLSSLLAVALILAFIINCSTRDKVKTRTSDLRSWSSMPRAVISDNKNLKICETPDCIHAASNVLLNMDSQFDPCENFYDFACGSYLKNTRIPEDKPSVEPMSILGEQVTEQIEAVIGKPIKPDEPRPFVLAKTLYKACMNTTAIEARGVQPLLNMLRRLGGWPVIDGDAWVDTTFSWKDLVYNCRSAGYSTNYLLSFFISTDAKNSTKRTISLDEASFGLNSEYLQSGLSNKLVQSYYEYMVDIAVLLGANRTRVITELQDSLQFEVKLANITLPLEKRRFAIILYNPMTIRELQQQFPSIPWLDYINRLLAPHVQVGLDEVTIVNVPKYIKALELLLEKTPKRTLANYVMWRVADASVSYLTDNLRRRQFAYFTALSGMTERQSRWKECANTVSEDMSIAVGALYIRKYFNENSKLNALEMVNDIRRQFRKILTEVDWMDDKTRKSALEKADAMTQHIAYPSELLDDRKLTEFYQGLEISSDKFLESVLNLTLFGTDYRIRKLREPINKTDWVTHGRPADVNGVYSMSENSIQFPAAILQGAFFSAERPAYMNYGAIGFVIGHEITHGFDDRGRQYDKNGDFVDWWEKATKAKFMEKAACIIEQYSNYTVAEVGMKVNGFNTLGENIADNGGIKEAYYAYQAWTHRYGEDARLPGLENYSPQQMFWLSTANSWCGVFRNEVIKIRITYDVHALARFRIVGSFSNMEEFARDFKCPRGSNMNPVNKCKVW